MPGAPGTGPGARSRSGWPLWVLLGTALGAACSAQAVAPAAEPRSRGWQRPPTAGCLGGAPSRGEPQARLSCWLCALTRAAAVCCLGLRSSSVALLHLHQPFVRSLVHGNPYYEGAPSIVAVVIPPAVLLDTFAAVLGPALQNVGQLWQGATQRPSMRSSRLARRVAVWQWA